MTKHIVTVVGARPQFIKAAAVSRALLTSSLRETIIHTGQHYDESMSDVFFRQLGIPPPARYLGVGSASHGAQTGRMLELLEDALNTLDADLVLVYGDTNSTLAGALAAAKMHIPVAHVEAGLRSFNRRMPEEINRVIADHISHVLFAPTEGAVTNLHREGIAAERIHLSGDVMYDVTRFHTARAESQSSILDEQDLRGRDYALLTVHRAENTDDRERLSAILAGASLFAATLPVVFPIHPRTKATLLRDNALLALARNLRLIDPLSFEDMLVLERNAKLIATDSGGVQKEAFFHRVPCVTLRDETEWSELVSLGWNRLISPTSAQSIAQTLTDALGSRGADAEPYGKGQAAETIVSILEAQA